MRKHGKYAKHFSLLKQLSTYLNKAIMKVKPHEAGSDARIGEGSIKDDTKHNIV